MNCLFIYIFRYFAVTHAALRRSMGHDCSERKWDASTAIDDSGSHKNKRTLLVELLYSLMLHFKYESPIKDLYARWYFIYV